MRYSNMEPTTTHSDRSQKWSTAANPSVGMLELLDNEGQVSKTWRLSQPRCTIGSSAESSLCIDDSSVAAVHALIVFGKNHTLIRAMGGQVRINGRSVREWLIDEPTMIQCGATRCIVYPSGFLRREKSTSHRVAAGSIADQAARLRSALSIDVSPLDDMSSTSNTESPLDDPAIQNASTEQPSNVVAAPTGPTFVITKLDANDVQTALEPLHLAVQAVSNGIIELTRRANETAAQLVDFPPINSNLTEMTHAIETLEDRVATISNYCENLLANVSESIEGQMSRFDEFLTKLSEIPSISTPNALPEPESRTEYDAFTQQGLKDYQEPIQSWHTEAIPDESRQLEFEPTVPTADDFPNSTSHPMPKAFAYGSGEFAFPSSEVEPASWNADVTEYSSQVTEEDIEHEAQEPALPSWFTESEPEVAPVQDEASPQVDSQDSSWSAAQLNPIYAEDSNRWLSESEPIRQEFELTPSDLNSFSPEALYQETIAATETAKSESTYESSSEIAFDEPVIDAIESVTQYEASYEETEEEVSDGDKEESIEDYMARLLQRVKGMPESDASPTKTSSNATKPIETIASPTTSREQSRKEDSQVFSSDVPVVKPNDIKPGEFAPRQVAPEKAANLAALRNLANDTARQAIHNSSLKKNELVLVGKVAIAILGLSGAILLLVLNGFRANVAMIGMIASFVVFLLWGYEAATQYKMLHATKVKEASDNENS